GAAGAHRDHHQAHAGDDRQQRQPDDQPQHGVAPGRGILVRVGLVHWTGPKKLLSMMRLSLPSMLSTTNRSSWRPAGMPSSATTLTATGTTCSGPAATSPAPARRNGASVSRLMR